MARASENSSSKVETPDSEQTECKSATPFNLKYTLFLTFISAVALLAVVFTGFSSPVTSEATEAPQHKIEIINVEKKADFDQLSSFSCAYVVFKASWCGHCKKLLKTIEENKQELNKGNYNSRSGIINVECTEDPGKAICAEHRVQGYPMIKFWRNNAFEDAPSSARDIAGIQSFFEGCQREVLQVITGTKLTELINEKKSDRGPFAVVYAKKDSKEWDEAKAAASNLHFDMMIYSVDNHKDLPSASEDVPAIHVFHKKNTKQVFGGVFNRKEIEIFLKSERVDILGEISRETYEAYDKANKLLLFCFVSDNKERELFTKKLTELAVKHRKDLNVGFIDAATLGEFGVSNGLRKEWPAVMISDTKMSSRFLMPQQGNELTDDLIVAFAEKVLAGSETPFYKSQEPVDDSKDNVQTIVNKNYIERVVKESGKDILVFFHAEWCGHCKSFAPTFDRVGEFLKEINSKVVLAKMNHPENDLPKDHAVEVRGYPTILFYKASDDGKRSNPITYEGERSKEGVFEFLIKNAKHAEDVKKMAEKHSVEIKDGKSNKKDSSGEEVENKEDQISSEEL